MEFIVIATVEADSPEAALETVKGWHLTPHARITAINSHPFTVDEGLPLEGDDSGDLVEVDELPPPAFRESGR